jgi:competence protein ComEC
VAIVEPIVAYFEPVPRITAAASLLFVAGAAAYAYHQPWLLIGVLGLSVIVGFLSKCKVIAAAAALLVSAGFGWSWMSDPHNRPTDIGHVIQHGKIAIIGEVLPNSLGKARFLEVRAEKLLFPDCRRVDGVVAVRITHLDQSAESNGYCAGCRVRLEGVLQAPTAPRYRWDFDEVSYFARRGISAKMQCQSTTVCGDSAKVETWSDRLFKRWSSLMDAARRRLLEAHRQALGRESGDLLSSMVIGEQAVSLSDDINAQFRDVGLSHVLAASGFNVTIVTAVVLFLGRRLIRNRLAVNGLALLSLAFYVGLAGACPSVLRAAIMCAVYLIARCFCRSVHLPACLCAALFITVAASPPAITDVGLQLSYAATAGIIYGADKLATIGDRNRFIRGCWQLMSVILMAQFSVVPLQLYYFGQLGGFFLLANLLVSPLLSFITVVGFASSALAIAGGCQFACWLMDVVANVPMSLMVAVVRYLASLKWAVLVLGQPEPLAIWLYYLCGVLGVELFARGKRGLSGLAFLVAVALILWRPPMPPLLAVSAVDGVLLVDRDRHACFVSSTRAAKAKEPTSSVGAGSVGSDAGNHSVWCRRALMVFGASLDRDPARMRSEVASITRLRDPAIDDAICWRLSPPRWRRAGAPTRATQLYVWNERLRDFTPKAAWP